LGGLRAVVTLPNPHHNPIYPRPTVSECAPQGGTSRIFFSITRSYPGHPLRNQKREQRRGEKEGRRAHSLHSSQYEKKFQKDRYTSEDG
jgi:hypothetical protein